MPNTPATSLAEAIDLFQRPFPADVVEWRIVQSPVKKSGRGYWPALVVAYVDARVVIDRLNQVCPADWETNYEDVPGGGGVRCSLTILGKTRADVGTPSKTEALKGAHSDALKRAAVHFGIGRSLYSIPEIRIESSHLNHNDEKGTWSLNRESYRIIKAQYAAWLSGEGEELFGPVIETPSAPADDPVSAEAITSAIESVPVDEDRKPLVARAVALSREFTDEQKDALIESGITKVAHLVDAAIREGLSIEELVEERVVEYWSAR